MLRVLDRTSSSCVRRAWTVSSSVWRAWILSELEDRKIFYSKTRKTLDKNKELLNAKGLKKKLYGVWKPGTDFLPVTPVLSLHQILV